MKGGDSVVQHGVGPGFEVSVLFGFAIGEGAAALAGRKGARKFDGADEPFDRGRRKRKEFAARS
jgi:hypothetical protein